MDTVLNDKSTVMIGFHYGFGSGKRENVMQGATPMYISTVKIVLVLVPAGTLKYVQCPAYVVPTASWT